ncbi:transcriptional regulator [Hoyosella sp. G463]|uniref:Transcriptional regulator n=1 Tax=Lolliginicoccus lacisalsi TaxID=2742202 RepID=A0A927JBI6_9ACTN|nr:transcriptional regulator [Lolliginicoccus lacisalsi]
MAGTSPSRSRRVALIVFVVIAASACLILGLWQWQRYDSMSGSAQNLGYALQWPLFAGFFVYAYLRFVRLERGEVDPRADELREIPEDLLPQRPRAEARSDVDDPQLREYNRLLAELAGEQPRTSDERNRE